MQLLLEFFRTLVLEAAGHDVRNLIMKRIINSEDAQANHMERERVLTSPMTDMRMKKPFDGSRLS